MIGSRTIDTALWRRSLLVLAGLVVAGFVLETSIAFRLSAFGVEPDFLLAIVYYFARYEGAVPGAVLGFFVGLLEDVSTPQDLGLNALAKCLVGFFTGKLWAGQRLFQDTLRAQAVTLFIAVLLHDFVVLMVVAGGDLGRMAALYLRLGLPTALYTAALSPLLVAVWSWLRERGGPRLHARIFRTG
jgi:rod shape-determining protein MreD